MMDELTKVKIIEAGFEVRTGHKTVSTSMHPWASPGGKEWYYLIVHNSRPAIACVAEWSQGLLAIDFNNNYFPEKWIVGFGETELEAWVEATTYWSEKVMQNALSL